MQTREALARKDGTDDGAAISRKRAEGLPKTMSNPFFTIGHSTRPIDEFVALLTAAEVRLVVDVRTVPRSRTTPIQPRDLAGVSRWTGCRVLSIVPRSADCAKSSLEYLPTPSGKTQTSQRRRLRGERRVSLRREKLTRAWSSARLAVMCAESLWWRCHRRIIADYRSPRARRCSISGQVTFRSAFDARSRIESRATDLSEGHVAHARPRAVSGFLSQPPKPISTTILEKSKQTAFFAV